MNYLKYLALMIDGCHRILLLAPPLLRQVQDAWLNLSILHVQAPSSPQPSEGGLALSFPELSTSLKSLPVFTLLWLTTQSQTHSTTYSPSALAEMALWSGLRGEEKKMAWFLLLPFSPQRRERNYSSVIMLRGRLAWKEGKPRVAGP